MSDVTAPGEPVARLIQAVKQGQADVVQVLVESSPQLAGARDVSGVSAVLVALYHGHADLAGWLASRRTDLDVFDAAALGDVARVHALVSADASLAHTRSPDGFTALALASFFGRLPVVQELIARGADVNAVSRNPGRYTPLTGAVAARAADVVRELLRHGADPNYRYVQGYTPLHLAAAGGSDPIVRELVEAGARVEVCTDDGKTPLDFAREKGHQSIVDWLELQAGRAPRS